MAKIPAKEQEAIDQILQQDGNKIVISNEFGGGLRRRPESKIKQVIAMIK